MTTIAWAQAVDLSIPNDTEHALATVPLERLDVDQPVLIAVYVFVGTPDADISAQDVRVRRDTVVGEQVGPTSNLVGNVIPVFVDPAGQPRERSYVLTLELVNAAGASTGVNALIAAIHN